MIGRERSWRVLRCLVPQRLIYTLHTKTKSPGEHKHINSIRIAQNKRRGQKGGIIAIISYKSLGLSRTKVHINKSTPMPCFFNHQCNGSKPHSGSSSCPALRYIVVPVCAVAPAQRQQQQQQETNNLAMQPLRLYLQASPLNKSMCLDL